MELAKAASITPPPVPKPSVKRELLFDPCETPKKAKAPVPTSKRPSISVVIKAEKVTPTAAKSGNSRVDPPAEPKVPVPVKPPPALIPPTKTEAAVPKPVATPARAAETPTVSERTHAKQQAAATLRRLKPLPSTPVASPDAPEPTPKEMAARRLSNKMSAMTDEEMEHMALENAILQELADKTDDEIDAIFKEINSHPLFKKFAQVQREETGDDDWTFELIEQIPIWELWVQKYVKPPPKAVPPTPEPKSVTPEPQPKQVALPKAGILRISPPPAKNPAAAKPPSPAKASPAKASSPVEPKPAPEAKHVSFALPPAVEPKVAPPAPPVTVPLTAQPGAPKEVSGFTISVKDGSNVTGLQKVSVDGMLQNKGLGFIPKDRLN